MAPKGGTKRSTRDEVEVSETALTDRFAGGVQRTDFGGELMESLGFSVSMWNGRSPGAALSVLCGASSKKVGWANSMVLELPQPDDAPQLFEPGRVRELFGAACRSWDPDWAVVTCSHWREIQKAALADPAPNFLAGWLTYLSDRFLGDRSNSLALDPEPFHAGRMWIAATTWSEVEESPLVETGRLIAHLGEKSEEGRQGGT